MKRPAPRKAKQKRRYTFLNTRIAIFLSLNVQVEQAGQIQLLTLPLLPLTAWLLAGWPWYARFRRLQHSVQIGLAEVWEYLNFWLTFTSIGWKSILYGVGVTV